MSACEAGHGESRSRGQESSEDWQIREWWELYLEGHELQFEDYRGMNVLDAFSKEESTGDRVSKSDCLCTHAQKR